MFCIYCVFWGVVCLFNLVFIFGICKYLQIFMQDFVERNCRMVSSSPAVCFLVNLLVLSQWVSASVKPCTQQTPWEGSPPHKNRNKKSRSSPWSSMRSLKNVFLASWFHDFLSVFDGRGRRAGPAEDVMIVGFLLERNLQSAVGHEGVFSGRLGWSVFKASPS